MGVVSIGGLGGCAAPDVAAFSPDVADDLAERGFDVDDVVCDHLVYGDEGVLAVQDAILAGGTVCVSGTFELTTTPPPPVVAPNPCPPPNTSQLCISPAVAGTPVTIVGLDDEDGQASFVGGVNAFLTPPGSTASTIGIHNVRIAGSQVSAVLGFNGDAEYAVTHVHVDGVVPVLVPAFNLYLQVGIQVSSFNENIVQPVTFAYNDVDAGSYTGVVGPIAVPVGIAIFGRFGTPPQNGDWIGPASAHGNKVTNWAGSGIASLMTPADITDNVVDTGPFANRVAVTPVHPCAAPNRLGFGSGIAVAGSLGTRLDGNTVLMEPGFTFDGTPAACQAGILLVNSVGTVVEDTWVWAKDVPAAKGIVAANSTGNVVEGFVVAEGNTGMELLGSNDNTVEDGLILKPTTGIRLTNTSGNTLDDLVIVRASVPIAQTNSADTLDGIWIR